MKRTNVRWKPEEIKLLAVNYVKYHFQSGMSRVAAVRESQRDLAPERRRDIKTMSMMPKEWFTEVERVRAEVRNAKPLEPIEVTPPTNEEVLFQLQQQFQDMYINVLVDKIVDRLVDRVADVVFERMKSQATVAPATQAKHNPHGEHEERAKKLKVVVLGLFDKNKQHVIEQYPNLKIVMVRKSMPTKDMKNVLRDAKVVLGMSDHIAHAFEKQVISMCQEGAYTRVCGTITAFRDALAKVSADFAEQLEG